MTSVGRLSKIQINKDLVKQEWIKSHPQPTKESIKTRKVDYVMQEWRKSYPDYNYINYEAIEELANLNDSISQWFQKRMYEFNTFITFPDWAADKMNKEEVDKIRAKFSKINEATRRASERKFAIAYNVREAHKRVDEQLNSDLKHAYEGDEKVFILTYPKNKLPIHYTLQLIQYRQQVENLSEEDRESETFVSVSDYENNVLDEWRKRLWMHYMEHNEITTLLESEKVDFRMPVSSVGDGHLLPISMMLNMKN